MYHTCYKHVFLQYGFNGTLFSKIRWANQKLFGEKWFLCFPRVRNYVMSEINRNKSNPNNF